MSWEDQGRQEHGWFGHSTAAPKDKPPVTTSDPIFAATNYAPRIDAIAHTVLMHMPRTDWHREVLSVNPERLELLRTAMTAWIAGRSLDEVAFGQRFLGSAISEVAIERLRTAAEAVRTAKTHEDLANASADLAAGMQAVGLDRWPRFLREAVTRAETYQRADNRIVLAQAMNTATDANPSQTPAAAPGVPPPGRYVADNPGQWLGQPSVGTGECVLLVQQATGTPRSTQWRPGIDVQGNTAIRPGTAIATFDANGHYSGHAAIYLGQDANGIRVIDQWNNRDREGRITSQHAPSERTLPFGDPRHSRINRGDSYRVLE